MNAQQNEELRRVTLEVLATRFPTALQVPAITRRINDAALLDFQATDDAVIGALEFLRGFQHVAVTMEPLGSTKYYAATSAGVLAWERR
jgi:hypothetical protein